MELERRVYSGWAFTADGEQKAKINSEIYKELMEKYKISGSLTKYNFKTNEYENINLDDYDLVYERKAGYAHADYCIKKNTTDLSSDELALIFDGGNLCFGYHKVSDNHYYVSED